MMSKNSREEFDDYIRDVGIDPNNLKNTDKAIYPIAFGAWQTQQFKIDYLKRKIAVFKAAFNDL